MKGLVCQSLAEATSKWDFSAVLRLSLTIGHFYKVVNKTAACAAQFAKCSLLYAYSRTTASSQLREHKQNFI